MILRRSACVLRPHNAQTPPSRSNTHSRKYVGLDRSRHSCTHASEQNVRRLPLTTPLHQRHMGGL